MARFRRQSRKRRGRGARRKRMVYVSRGGMRL